MIGETNFSDGLNIFCERLIVGSEIHCSWLAKKFNEAAWKKAAPCTIPRIYFIATILKNYLIW